MKNSIFAISTICLLAGLFLTNCKKSNSPEPDNGPITQSGNSVTLQLGDCASMTDHGLTICIDSIKPYLCPCEGDCIWSGSVDVHIKVTDASGIVQTAALTLFEISLTSGLRNDVKIGNKTILFKSVNDVECKHQFNPEKYKITLVFSE